MSLNPAAILQFIISQSRFRFNEAKTRDRTFNVLRKSLILRNNSFLFLLNLNKFSKSFAKIGIKLNFGLLYS